MNNGSLALRDGALVRLLRANGVNGLSAAATDLPSALLPIFV